jgi:hypothetical protein
LKEKRVKNSFSQAGEDMVLNFLFNEIGLKNISYLDLGSNDPMNGNNTFKFYQLGGSGILVEADSYLIKKIKKERPRDKVIHAGVNIEKNKSKEFFYVFNENAISTFDKNEADLRVKSGKYKLLRIENIETFSINYLIENYFESFPTLLSIDIEGLDFKVLQSLDYETYPIPVICAETCFYSENYIRPKNQEISDYLISKGYIIYADTYINTIYVNKKWFFGKH